VTPSALALTHEMSEKARRSAHPIVFLSPSEIRAFEIPPDYLLVGDSHLVRGGITLIGGQAGVGKSRALVGLALAGATGQSWFGLDVRARFKTAIFQTENGRIRLKQEFSGFPEEGLEDRIRICEPPPYGLAFEDPSFCLEAWNQLKEFKPDVIAVDPLNSIARDDRMGDYRAALNSVRDFAAGFEKEVALVIVAHTRKPKPDDETKGRGLLHEFSGSYILGSVARCAFIMQHASTDPKDDRIVWTCCKNNDGTLGSPSPWRRRNGLFVPIEEFDMDGFLAALQPRRVVSLQDVREVFQDGKAMTRKIASEELAKRTSLKKSACYDALKLNGKFGNFLEERDGLLQLKPQSGEIPSVASL
jgi:AAA domain